VIGSCLQSYVTTTSTFMFVPSGKALRVYLSIGLLFASADVQSTSWDKRMFALCISIKNIKEGTHHKCMRITTYTCVIHWLDCSQNARLTSFGIVGPGC